MDAAIRNEPDGDDSGDDGGGGVVDGSVWCYFSQ